MPVTLPHIVRTVTGSELVTEHVNVFPRGMIGEIRQGEWLVRRQRCARLCATGHVAHQAPADSLQTTDKLSLAGGPARAGLGPLDAEIRHEADRSGHAGLVELWPLLEAERPSASDPWMPPAVPETGFAAPDRLARLIAETVEDWLETGEDLPSRGRAVGPAASPAHLAGREGRCHGNDANLQTRWGGFPSLRAL